MKKYQFYIQKFETVSKICVLCNDWNRQLVFNYFTDYFLSKSSNEFILNEIKSKVHQDFGNNDFNIKFTEKGIIFDLFFDKIGMDIEKVFPYLFEKNDFIEFLNEIQDFLSRYESCQIPGIIPESKLDTWSCVPNEYIKEEWWDRQKKNRNENGA